LRAEVWQSALEPWISSAPAVAVADSALASAGGLTKAALALAGVGMVALGVVAVATMAGRPPGTQKTPAAAVVTVAGRPLPALQTLSPTERRTYELLDEIRSSVAPSRPDHWIPVLRELKEIGAPAVAAICVELDRTERDTEQRLHLMALRLIKDPRAVPTLIRALERVASRSSDHGFQVEDQALRAFLDAHYWNPQQRDPRHSSFNRGITECIAALEAITGHSEGHAPIRDVTADRAAFADRWRRWWEVNQDRFATAAELATVEAARYDGDLVSAVAATKPPIFPTGPDVRLSPEVELIVHDQGLADRPAFVDLDRARALCLYEGRGQESEEEWFQRSGVDLLLNRVYRTGAPAETASMSVLGTNVRLWLIENGRYETLEDEVRKPQRLSLGNYRPVSDLIPQDGAGQPLEERYPSTWLFETGDGGRGIFQIVGSLDGHRALRMRIRRWERGSDGTALDAEPATEATTHPASTASLEQFGESKLTTLYAPASGRVAGVDLETGRTQPIDPAHAGPTFSNVQIEEARKAGLDLVTFAAGDQTLSYLRGAALEARQVSDEAWDELAPWEARRILDRYRADEPNPLRGVIGLSPMHRANSSTWVLRTGDGSVGLLRLIEANNEEVRFQVKLAEPVPP
jgi:hypothetical protein